MWFGVTCGWSFGVRTQEWLEPYMLYLGTKNFWKFQPASCNGKCHCHCNTSGAFRRFLQSLCVGPWAMRVWKCFQHDQRITGLHRLHSTPSCFAQFCIASHGQPRRTNGVQFNYACFLAQYGQLGWMARAWGSAQKLCIKWCAETVDIFGRQRSSSNLNLCGLSWGSVKHSEWSVQNEFIQHTYI